MAALVSISRIASGVLLGLLLGGCQTVGYYAQAVGGQMEIWRASRPIEKLIADETTDPVVRELLQRAVEIRDFASRELALPDNQSYRRYADLQRPYVVWNVFAAPEFSLQAEQWCFVLAGCVAYRGYFSGERAQRFADGLTQDGLDVFVAGIPAYSTLGWFADPVLNTFLHYPETELARLIFHELAHHVVYVKDDTAFNESFAVAVELEGVRRWLARSGTRAQLAEFEAAQERRRDFLELFGRYREILQALYAQTLTETEMRAGKVDAFARMREDYARLRERWGGFAGYDRWFDQPLNNARLIAVAAYTDLVPGFEALLNRHVGDFTAFYAEVRGLARLSREERRQRLDALIGSVSPASSRS